MLAPAATFVASNGFTYRCAFPARHPGFFVPCQDCHPEPPPALRPAPRVLSDEDRTLIAFDLRIAADRYAADAVDLDQDSGWPASIGRDRLADQFRRQATRARAYADLFEDLDTPIQGDSDASL